MRCWQLFRGKRSFYIACGWSTVCFVGVDPRANRSRHGSLVPVNRWLPGHPQWRGDGNGWEGAGAPSAEVHIDRHHCLSAVSSTVNYRLGNKSPGGVTSRSSSKATCFHLGSDWGREAFCDRSLARPAGWAVCPLRAVLHL